jgi:hypothetical protein
MGQRRYVQENFQTVLSLESDHSANLQRCSPSFKTFTFPGRPTPRASVVLTPQPLQLRFRLR